ncbi:MAG TPA: hypothetical protein VMC48_05180 [Methanobacterium sp.]|nr:hypothetical protein [Methanobacterium sp.]
MKKLLIIILSLSYIFTFIPSAEAHILIVANGDGTTPDSYEIVKNTADLLKSKGYNVLELYGENATTKNIIKGMYNADAMIYAGHGVFIIGNYDNHGGTASPPFGIVGSDGVIWGYGDKMKEGTNGKTFEAPFKKNIPVILFGACFSSGWVETYEVANPIETVYNFSQMFTGSGANYYATAYIRKYQGKEVVDLVAMFMNGANSLGDANKKNYGFTINQETNYQGEAIWRNDHGYNAFVGNWNGTFPQPDQTTPYNDTAAEAWYDGKLPGPSDELENSHEDQGDQIGQFIDGVLGWVYFMVNSVLNSNIPDINITTG